MRVCHRRTQIVDRKAQHMSDEILTWQPISGQDVDALIASVPQVAAAYDYGYKFCMAIESIVGTKLRPDWSQAPTWANWWAVDPDGICHWFDNEPILTDVTVHRELIGPHWSYWGSRQAVYDAINIPIGCDWRTLKSKRPQGVAHESTRL